MSASDAGADLGQARCERPVDDGVADLGANATDDLGVDVDLQRQGLAGRAFERDPQASEGADPQGWKKLPIFELEREIAVKRRSHYAGEV